MLILTFFAFLAGIVTVLSPCVLPILPAILSAGTNQRSINPYGLVIGLVASFTFFTLALTAIVQATSLSPDLLRDVAILLVCLFALVMIFPPLSNAFTRITSPIADIGQRLQGRQHRPGFFGGLLFGSALGLLWTPCAGPILAAITTLVATQEVTLTAVLLTLTYSIGAAIPIFAIAYGSDWVIHSSTYLSSHTQGIRQVFGVLMLMMAVIMALRWDLVVTQRLAVYLPAIVIENNPLVQEEIAKLNARGVNPQDNPSTIYQPGHLPNYGESPPLTGITNWINSPPLTLDQLKGKVVLIDFWTYTCINCLRTLPYREKWYADYKDKGFVIIGVHTPEFEFEKSAKNVKQAADRLGVKYPIAQDNNYATWKAFSNNYWPAHYLIDKDGNIRMVHFGEGAYVETENDIRQLLGMEPMTTSEPKGSFLPTTAETYLGTKRAENYTSDNALKTNETTTYSFQDGLLGDQVGLKGLWKVEGERITSASDDSYLALNFLAEHVYFVLSGSSSKPIEVTLDGKPAGKITLDGDRKYDIVTTTYGRHDLILKIPKGVSAYAFTFGAE